MKTVDPTKPLARKRPILLYVLNAIPALVTIVEFALLGLYFWEDGTLLGGGRELGPVMLSVGVMLLPIICIWGSFRDHRRDRTKSSLGLVLLAYIFLLPQILGLWYLIE